MWTAAPKAHRDCLVIIIIIIISNMNIRLAESVMYSVGWPVRSILVF